MVSVDKLNAESVTLFVAYFDVALLGNLKKKFET